MMMVTANGQTLLSKIPLLFGSATQNDGVVTTNHSSTVNQFEHFLKLNEIRSSSMNARSILPKIIFGFLGIFMLSQGWAAELDEAMKFWETKVLLCEAHPNGVKSPSKQTGDPSQPCDDGDMSLFNGLLCMAGDERGCLGVAEAQDRERRCD